MSKIPTCKELQKRLDSLMDHLGSLEAKLEGLASEQKISIREEDSRGDWWFKEVPLKLVVKALLKHLGVEPFEEKSETKIVIKKKEGWWKK